MNLLCLASGRSRLCLASGRSRLCLASKRSRLCLASKRSRLARCALVIGFGAAAIFGVLSPGFARDNAELPTPPLPTGSYLAGRFAQHAEDWKAAARFMGDALARDPEDIDLLRRAYLLKLGEGRITEALPLARRLVEHDPGASLAVLLLVSEDAVAGRFDDAAQHLATMSSEGVARFAGPLLGAWLAQARGQPPEAVEAALASLTSQKGLGVLLALQRAMIADVGGNTEAAAKWYNEALNGGGPTTLRVVQAVGSFLHRNAHPDQAQTLYGLFAREN
ncbi:MAG: hypothetical protein WCF85_19980, partial [Rhodospirillaceae bacterium]